MSLKFEDNTIKDFDVKKTFGKMNFLTSEKIFENDGEGGRTDVVREQRITVYSEGKEDQLDIAIPANVDVSMIEYDDEIELVGEVTARGWLSSYQSGDFVGSEQAFKIRAEGIRKTMNRQPAARKEGDKEQTK